MKKFLLLLRDYITGDFFYKNYLDHAAKNHPQQKILDKKSFLRRRENEKWEKVNRCC